MMTTAFSADDLTNLSDEFNDASALANWQRVYQTEGWGFDQLEAWDIDTSSAGRMTMMPYTSSWYNEWRGVHAYKEVSGDFVVTTDVEPRNRAGTGAPGRTYSLAGIMVRTPRSMTQGPADWTPQGQNYIFLSMGTGDAPGTYQFEVKTTINSNSQLEISSGGQRALIQVARIGSSFVVLRRLDGGEWEVHRRYDRPDMPQTLHVGMTSYTDWPTCSAVGDTYHNENLLTGTISANGNTVTAQPDLVARFDYFRFQRPQIPGELAGRNFSSAAEVSNEEILSFLGDAANVVPEHPLSFEVPTANDAARIPTEGFPVRFTAPLGVGGMIEWSLDGGDWTELETFTGSGEPMEIVDDTATGQPRRIYRFNDN